MEDERESKIAIKQAIMKQCLQKQSDLITTAREAMKEAQDTANEQDNAIEEKFESFKAQMQQDRDMYAKKLDEHLSNMAVLKRISSTMVNQTVTQGSVVVTSAQNYFISISIGSITVEGKNYFAISSQSPIYEAMAEKKKGDTFEFRGQKITLLDVF
ncbi:hypothetical protein [Penaeicola halotolerans]|uniref:hypothetical protein n=1 Tax=Penaeicola halotolerans TaxID=2793196 RepID=UPI001CF85BF1|nr:hypothetical protein [Penaeicola halotolerans]